VNPHKWYEHGRFDPAGRAAWQERVAQDHPEVNAVYPPGFWKGYAQFCAGDASKLEIAVAFLEADPYVFGSGCVKEDFIHALKHMDLPPSALQRLQRVVLSVVDTRDGREFRDYCRLARRVNSPALREQLRQRLTRARPSAQSVTDDQPDLLPAIRQDRAIRRRARWVLEALGENQAEEKRP
jgi:hypothetical protein